MKGIYVLAILIRKEIVVKIGALGEVSLRKGFYAYVGSAQRNLEKRLNRHFKKVAKNKFWHIDYLLEEDHATVLNVFFKDVKKSEECITAQHLGKQGFPIKGFGCSDCHCQSHFFMFKNYNVLRNTCLRLGFKPLCFFNVHANPNSADFIFAERSAR
ncbi:MAG: GIY-YIG nuclease family protein [Candidatus Bathyarchaeia archaeon]